MKSITTVLLTLSSVATLHGATLKTHLTLDGGQQVPVVTTTTAVGEAMVSIDDTTGETIISGSYTGVTSGIIVARLYGAADPGETSRAYFSLTIDLDLDDPASGKFSGTSMLAPDRMAALLNGKTYINIHSNDHLLGEIRGQVPALVPEPGSTLFLGLATALGLFRRRR